MYLCWECCIDPDNKTDLKIADHKYQAYDLVLETIKKITCKKDRGRGRGKVNFEEAIRKACSENQLVDGYLGYSEQQQNQNADNWNYKHRLWEFRYKIQDEEPRVHVMQQDPLIISWNTSYIEERIA